MINEEWFSKFRFFICGANRSSSFWMKKEIERSFFDAMVVGEGNEI